MSCVGADRVALSTPSGGADVRHSLVSASEMGNAYALAPLDRRPCRCDALAMLASVSLSLFIQRWRK